MSGDPTSSTGPGPTTLRPPTLLLLLLDSLNRNWSSWCLHHPSLTFSRLKCVTDGEGALQSQVRALHKKSLSQLGRVSTLDDLVPYELVGSVTIFTGAGQLAQYRHPLLDCFLSLLHPAPETVTLHTHILARSELSLQAPPGEGELVLAFLLDSSWEGLENSLPLRPQAREKDGLLARS